MTPVSTGNMQLTICTMWRHIKLWDWIGGRSTYKICKIGDHYWKRPADTEPYQLFVVTFDRSHRITQSLWWSSRKSFNIFSCQGQINLSPRDSCSHCLKVCSWSFNVFGWMKESWERDLFHFFLRSAFDSFQGPLDMDMDMMPTGNEYTENVRDKSMVWWMVLPDRLSLANSACKLRLLSDQGSTESDRGSK